MVLVTSRGLNNLNFSLIFSNRDEHSLLLLRFATTLLEQDFYERTSSWYVTLYSQGYVPVCHNWHSYLSNRNSFLSELDGNRSRTYKNLPT